MEMKSLESVVENVLRTFEETREDNFLLCYKTYEKWLELKNRENLLNQSFESFMTTAKDNKLPSMESITRARRKIQAKHMELLGFKMFKHRLDKEIQIIKYAGED